jgi:HTH-type transcriptional regulator / antitoxin HigA
MSKLTMHPIRSNADHDAVMARITALATTNPLPGSSAGDELDVLSLLVRSYEDANFPIGPISLEAAITFRAEQMGLTGKELDALFGGSGRRSEVLGGKRALSKGMANRLRAIGVPDGLLLRLLIGDEPKHRGAGRAAGRSSRSARRSKPHVLSNR